MLSYNNQSNQYGFYDFINNFHNIVKHIEEDRLLGEKTRYDSGKLLDSNRYPKNFVKLYERDIDRLKIVLKIYDSYNATKICISKIIKNIYHPLWLPNELWLHILNYIKDDIEHFNLNNKNNTSLYELEIYKQELDSINNSKQKLLLKRNKGIKKNRKKNRKLQQFC